jgi:helix-turn-helix protein
MTVQDLRRARKLTQVRMAKALGIGQDGVSKLEKRSDLLLSTLRKTVEAMGGSLFLVAEFPDRGPVVLSGISEVEAHSRHTSLPTQNTRGSSAPGALPRSPDQRAISISRRRPSVRTVISPSRSVRSTHERRSS